VKRWLLLLSIPAIATSILPLNVRPATACSGGPFDVQAARELIINEIELVVIGAVVEPDGQYTEIDVETVYKGPLVSRITLDQPAELVGTYSSYEPPIFGVAGPDCRYLLRGAPGERYFLVLGQAPGAPGKWEVFKGSVAMREAGSGRQLIYEAALTLPAGGGRPTTDDRSVALYCAVLGPVAFLVGAALLVGAGRTSQRMRNG
jgi:hypothetical protein